MEQTMPVHSSLVANSAKHKEDTKKSVDKMALRVWIRMFACTQLVEKRVRKLLRKKYNTTLPRFDVLAQLDSSNGTLSMGDLSQRLMVTTGNVTGLIDLMEQEGLVERHPHPTDRRSTLVQMTALGEQLCSTAMPAHQEWIQEMLKGMTEDELSQLHQLLGKTKAAIAAREDQWEQKRTRAE